MTLFDTAEHQRLADSEARQADWKHWGPYLSERAWGTVREDYSPHGAAWESLPHDHARSRAYRWNEDGLGGFSNRFQNLCLAVALWNGRRPVFGQERLFQEDPHWRDHLLFYEYFHGDTGAGVGASHQTGWTALAATLLQESGR
ncbi:MAG: hypothetical protein HUU23_00515 [Caldilineales bacterium]|nr:hypothetical protein [Caldilineales bacterium]